MSRSDGRRLILGHYQPLVEEFLGWQVVTEVTTSLVSRLLLSTDERRQTMSFTMTTR